MTDKEHIKGEAKKMEGRAKDAAGSLTDDAELQAEGKKDKLEGEARKTAGDIKDAAKKSEDA